MMSDSTSAQNERRSARHIGAIMLWTLSVGASVRSIFSGWNAGLSYAGFGCMLVASLMIISMYVFLITSVFELSALMPFARRTVSYVRLAFGT